MREITFEIVASCTINRDDGQRVSLKRGSKLKIDPENHGFDEQQFERARQEGKLRPVPRG